MRWEMTAATMSTMTMYMATLRPKSGTMEDISSSRGCIIGCSLTTLETVQIMSRPTTIKASSTLKKIRAM